MASGENPFSAMVDVIREEVRRGSGPSWNMGEVVSTAPLQVRYQGVLLNADQVAAAGQWAAQLKVGDSVPVLPDRDDGRFAIMQPADSAAFASAGHGHGNVSGDGKVGTVADLILGTGTDGLIVAKTIQQVVNLINATNQNLLHNWDFRNPVNQRAVSGEISTGSYFYDRWIRNDGTVTTSAAYLTIGASAIIEQRIEGNLLAGRTVTVSVMVGGIVYSGTGTFPTSAGTVSVTITGWGTATLGFASGYMYVLLSPAAASNVQAVKLESGEYSTLISDPPVDYGAELFKCFRFAINLDVQFFGYGYTTSTTAAQLYLPLPTPMRGVPTFSTTAMTLRYNASTLAGTITNSSVRASGIRLSVTGTNFTANHTVAAYFTTAGACFASADL